MTDKRVLNLIKEEAIIIVNFRKGIVFYFFWEACRVCKF